MPDVYEQRTVKGSPAQVAQLFRDPGAWLDEAARSAGHFGRAADVRLRAELGLGRLHTTVSKRVRIEVGAAQLVRDHFVIPLTWEASGFAGMFPVMDGLVEVHHAGPGHSRIVFWGRYDPPLGRTGELIDRYVAHEVAALTVQRLLDSFEEQATLQAAEVS